MLRKAGAGVLADLYGARGQWVGGLAGALSLAGLCSEGSSPRVRGMVANKAAMIIPEAVGDNVGRAAALVELESV